jgi:outer membrane protein TolC
LELEHAEANTRTALGNVLPTLTGTVTLKHNENIGAGPTPATTATAGSLNSSVAASNYLGLALTATATLINLQGFQQYETEKVLEKAASISIEDVRRRLALQLARAIVGLASARRITVGDRDSLKSSLERLGLTRKQVHGGIGDRRDMVRAKQDTATTRSAIPNDDDAVLTAAENLGVLIGVNDGIEMDESPEEIEAEVQSFCGNASGLRPDIEYAKTEVEIANRNVDNIALVFVPTLTAQAQILGTDYFAGNPTGFGASWNAGITLTVPFFDGGVRYGQLRANKILVEEQKAQEYATEITAWSEQVQAIRAVQVAQDAYDSAKEARDLAKEADVLARKAYLGGTGTNFDMIDAGRTLRTAETTLIIRQLALISARVSLPFLTGTCAGTRGN